MEIHLIRHGKTVANEQKLYCGTTDLPLSEAGIAELRHLKERGIYPKSADLYYTSGLLRAEQTLDLLYDSVKRSVMPALAEFNFGDFEMKSYETLKERHDYQVWIADNTGLVACPNGDNRQEFIRRCTQGYAQVELNARNALNSFVVCHGGVIACIMEFLFPTTHNFYEWQPEPGHGYTITRTKSNLKSYKKI